MSKISFAPLGRVYDHVFVPKSTWLGRALQALAKLVLLAAVVAAAAYGLVTVTNNNYKESTATITVCEVEETSTDKGQALYLIETSEGDDYSLMHPDGKKLRAATAYTITHDGLDRILDFDRALDVTPERC